MLANRAGDGNAQGYGGETGGLQNLGGAVVRVARAQQLVERRRRDRFSCRHTNSQS
jgi:hypothetical protein